MTEMPKNRFNEAAAIYTFANSPESQESVESIKIPGTREEQLAKLKALTQKLEKEQKKIAKLDRNNEDRKAGAKARLEATKAASKTFEVENSNIWGIQDSKENKSTKGNSQETTSPIDIGPKIKKPTTLGENLGAEDDSKPGPKLEGAKESENTPESESLKKVLKLVLATRGPEAMSEFENQFKTESRRYKMSKEAQAESLRHAEKMFATEAEFFRGVENFHRTKGFHSVIGDAFNPNGRKLPPEVQKLKDEWIKSRSEYFSFKKGEGFNPRDSMGAAVYGAEEAQKRARERGLSSRDKKGIEGFWEKNKKRISEGMRAVGTSAMLLTGAAALTVGSVPLGIAGLLFGSASAFTLYKASRAEKGSKAEKNWNLASRWASLFGIPSLVVGGAVRAAHKLNGTERLAQEHLSTSQYKGDMGDHKYMEKVSKRREGATYAAEQVDAGARLGNIAGSTLLAGTAIGIGMSEFPSGGFEHHHVVDHLSIGSHENHVYINDADKLLGHFAHKLRHDHFTHGHVPKSVETLEKNINFHKDHLGKLHINGEDSLARKLGLEGPDGSTVMHAHDQIRILDNGDIILHKPGHPEMDHVLINHNGHLNRVDPESWQNVSHHGQSHPVESQTSPVEHQPTTHQEAGDTSHDHDDIQLNNAEHQRDLHGESTPTSPTVPSSASPHVETTPQTTLPPHHEASPTSAAPEVHPTPETSIVDHFFANSGEHINVHGVDLSKPQVLYYHGKPMAHGINADDSYTRAAAEAQKLAASPNHGDTKVYFISTDRDASGVLQHHMNAVEVPAVGGAPRLVPNYAESMPPLPTDADYLPLPPNFPQ